MEWLRENSVFLLFFIVMIAMHLFGRGMHGGHCQESTEHKGHGGDGVSGTNGKEKSHGGCC